MKMEKKFVSTSSDTDFDETSPSEKLLLGFNKQYSSSDSKDDDYTIEYINGNLNSESTNESLANQFAMNINDMKECKKMSPCSNSSQKSLKIPSNSNKIFNDKVSRRYNSTPYHSFRKGEDENVKLKRQNSNKLVTIINQETKHSSGIIDILPDIYYCSREKKCVETNVNNRKFEHNLRKASSREKSSPNLRTITVPKIISIKPLEHKPRTNVPREKSCPNLRTNNSSKTNNIKPLEHKLRMNPPREKSSPNLRTNYGLKTNHVKPLLEHKLRTNPPREKSSPNLRTNNGSIPAAVQNMQRNSIKKCPNYYGPNIKNACPEPIFYKNNSSPKELTPKVSPNVNRKICHSQPLYFDYRMPQPNYHNMGILLQNHQQDPYAFQKQANLFNNNLNPNIDNRFLSNQNPYNYQSVFQPLLPTLNVMNVPRIERNYNFLGIVQRDPNEYIKEYGSDLINKSNLPDLEITKWAQKNIIFPHNLKLVSKHHRKNFYQMNEIMAG